MFRELKICAALLFFINIGISFADELEAPVVTLPQGQIQGHILQSPLGKKPFYAYQDIPYAAPPIGTLRFKEPVAPQNWAGIKNTTHNTHSCYLNGRVSELPPDVTESEDCLYLNVYTPTKPINNSFDSSIPVLFWIHGGGFYFGDGTYQTYGPQFLIDYDIVIVSINYRLGAFGFLTTEDGIIPANRGLKDQLFALQWTKTNIHLFGGDPEQITIVGESAGGASVGYHLVSKKSKDLFVGAVLQSGTALCTFGYNQYARYYAFEAGKILDSKFNVTSDSSTALLEVLQNASAKDINNISLEVPVDKALRIGGRSHVWLPVVEDETLDGAFLTGPMHSDMKSGNINKVPIMIGYNSEEELRFLEDDDSLPEEAVKLDKNMSLIVNNAYNMKDKDKAEAGGLLRLLYTDGRFEDNFGAIVKFKTDADFATPVIRHAEVQSNYTDVYLYQFSYKGMMGFVNRTVDGAEAVGHTEDLRYLWHSDFADDGGIFSAGDRLTQRRLLKLWSNFVKYRNPTPEKDPLLNNIVWPKLTAGNITYLNINRTLEVKKNPRQYQDYKAIVEKYGDPQYTY